MAKDLKTLEDLYGHTLADAYSAETQIVEALPKMVKAATSVDLAEGFEEHLGQTKEHVKKIKELIDNLPTKPSMVECKGMKGLLEEGAELLKEDIGPEVLDAGLIAAAQKVEHYEIAQYGTLATWAELLGKDEDLETINDIKDQEIETDEKLTEVAQSTVNLDAEEEEETVDTE
jgi:ferritin-like metal-binding protein YciE